ncbi:MAG TPA: SH3 domain-containing C40 family peptidase [Longimicrobiales bacterium]|nr:SH3 domain-containing C40 family peptidase [Longimicrobiales bacterium]
MSRGDPVGRFKRDLERLKEKYRLDPRVAVIDVRLEQDKGGRRIVGVTTHPDLVKRIIARMRLEPMPDNAVRVLPDERIGPASCALVSSALAPVLREPVLHSPQVSQYVLGHRLDLLEQRDVWWHVRGEDGYIGWIHEGYLLRGENEWAAAWERGVGGEPVVSLGGMLLDEEERPFARLPWGARVVREGAKRYRLPDGRVGTLYEGGETVASDRLLDRFPTRGESVIRTARRWLGAPYIWGGVVATGADCSGFVQSVYWMHGIALPRDSDLQAQVGAEVAPESDWSGLRAGDLLYFAEEGERISHVAISTGGAGIIHSSLSNGGVAENDLSGTGRIEALLRTTFRSARRVLPD